MEKLSYVDQSTGSDTLDFILISGAVINVKEADVLSFIEENGMNERVEGCGIYSDPYGTEAEVTTEPSDYLDNNFKYVCDQYFKSIIAINLIKKAA